MSEHQARPIDILSQDNPDPVKAELAIKALARECERSHATTAGIGFDPELGDIDLGQTSSSPDKQ